ncbi:hypothetical protein GCWU000325_02390 [Alloprevotella tannerae ATCC 51259]|uniref:Uncharacterized protein n=1 Tax=Alloprevotella tannerae ATCC 51259 TaxID=626522 RepID=C9LJH8_9BACT|nr:hypothetical protein GCWU000325_02390 [Alloprevotella tannerae ATCC 51259]
MLLFICKDSVNLRQWGAFVGRAFIDLIYSIFIVDAMGCREK